jgi:hypothetical protein
VSPATSVFTTEREGDHQGVHVAPLEQRGPRVVDRHGLEAGGLPEERVQEGLADQLAGPLGGGLGRDPAARDQRLGLAPELRPGLLEPLELAGVEPLGVGQPLRERREAGPEERRLEAAGGEDKGQVAGAVADDQGPGGVWLSDDRQRPLGGGGDERAERGGGLRRVGVPGGRLVQTAEEAVQDGRRRPPRVGARTALSAEADVDIANTALVLHESTRAPTSTRAATQSKRSEQTRGSPVGVPGR